MVTDKLPFVNASMTPLFSKYFRNSCFFDSGVYKEKEGRYDHIKRALERVNVLWSILYLIVGHFLSNFDQEIDNA